jgi:hypothetical protein
MRFGNETLMKRVRRRGAALPLETVSGIGCRAAMLIVNDDAILTASLRDFLQRPGVFHRAIEVQNGFAPFEMKLIGAQLPERVLPRIQFRDLINGVIRYAIDLPDGRTDLKFKRRKGFLEAVLECVLHFDSGRKIFRVTPRDKRIRKIYAGPTLSSAFFQGSSCVTYLRYLNAVDAQWRPRWSWLISSQPLYFRECVIHKAD